MGMSPKPRPPRESLVDFHVRYAEPLALVMGHCDILERLELAPTTARVRGILFRAIAEEVEVHGKLAEYRRYFGDTYANVYSAIPYYPLSDYLVRIATAGALVASPDRVHAGMYEISRGNAKSFAGSLLGRTLIRLLARDPVRLLEQGISARRQMASYGKWTLLRHGPQSIEVQHENEYVWIESAIAGSAAGTFDAQGIEAKIDVKLVDRFNGSFFFSW
jgi:uncharacterized protein (TIGR02265 family)